MYKSIVVAFLLATILPCSGFAQTELQARVLGGTTITLSWETGESAQSYKVYRSTEPRFTADAVTLLAETKNTTYSDKDLGTYAVYYYTVISVDASGEALSPSDEIRQETFIAGVLPKVRITGVNTEIVKKYEKFEVELDISDVGIHNPYDPEDIDVFANFTSPDGNTIRINGFYDNYQDADQWKIRFSPGLTGQWTYKVYVRDAGGLGETSFSLFTAVDSEHHGWIKPSDSNPHYFEQDDGTSWYAVGVYSPWRNDDARFETYAEHDANLFAIWDITYGGFVNGHGVIEEELGRYNQTKLGKIDSLLVILEDRDIKLMYAIWPHDLFSETVWAAQWKINPYRELIDVVDVYSDPLVWKFQEKKYRYLVARYAYSRSMGIWELINEMNGTDGWAKGRHQEALDWVGKADKWFETNDPYNHPVTASFSGGFREYREELYVRNDVPNIHVYPAQGWAKKYPGDDIRSNIHNYAWASRRFWNAFDKPAIFGESGADLTYFKNENADYHESYHNVIWASLSNGLAGIPVWWEYTHLNDQDWDQLKNLSGFVADIDFANLPYQLAHITADAADAFALEAGSNAFGWARSYDKLDISGTEITIHGLANGSFDIIWYDTWSGMACGTDTVASRQGVLSMKAPKLPKSHPDIAFKIEIGLE